MHWREQGDRGEMAAAAWYAAHGGYVYWPLGHSPHCDFVVLWDERLVRVQVKTCGIQANHGRWPVTVCTRGGNRSWNGIVKRLDATNFEELFVLVRDGRRWRIPAGEVDGRSGVTLGGPKYAEFEVEPAPEFGWPALH